MKPAVIFVEASTTGAGARANELAQANGFHVVLLARNAGGYDSHILSFADEIIDCDTNDLGELLGVVRRRSRHVVVVAVTTTADMYVPQAAFIAGELRLPGLRYEAALRARNKHSMRRALAERAPEHNVPFHLVRDESEALRAADSIGYPLIAKLQEENDGAGVRLIHNRRQLKDYVMLAVQWSHNAAGQMMPPGFLLEAYCDGLEFSVETIQYPGSSCQVMGVTTKEMIGLDRDHFIEAGHSFPYLGPEAALAASATRRVLAALEIDHGAIHTECRINGDDVTIMEINPRLAGGKIGSHLIEMATGCSAVRAMLDAALGKRAEWHPLRDDAAAIRFVFAETSGIFRGIENVAEILAMPGIEIVSPIAKSGARVGPPCSNRDSVAEILGVGPTAFEAYFNVKAALARIRISIDPV